MVSIILFSKDRPMQTHAYLESLFFYSDANLKKVSVLYYETKDISYKKVMQNFPEVNWVRETNFHNDLMRLIHQSDEYIMFGCDDVVFVREFNLEYAKKILENKNDIFGFSFRLGTNILPIPSTQQTDDILIWNWKDSLCNHYNYPWELDCTLYRKSDVLQILKKKGGRIKSPNFFESDIALNTNKYIYREKMACLNKKNQAIVITVNRVQETHLNPIDTQDWSDVHTLNDMYNNKENTLDIQKIATLKNKKIHVDATYFILRKKDERLKIKKNKKQNKIIKKVKCFIKNLKFLSNYSLKTDYTDMISAHLKIRLLKELSKRQIPSIMNYEESVDYLIEQNISMARFGDGEFELIKGNSILFQEQNYALSARLLEILQSNNPNIIIGIGKMYYDFSIKNINPVVEEYLEKFLVKNEKLLNQYINYDQKYIPTEITQLYQTLSKYDFEIYFDKIKKIWKDKDIALILGKGIFDKLQYNIFDCAKSIEYQYAPTKNAFNEYDNIFEQAKKIDKNKIIVIILGPTATVLAYDLAKEGYRALDFGHIAKDYNAFCLNKTKKISDLKDFFDPD